MKRSNEINNNLGHFQLRSSPSWPHNYKVHITIISSDMIKRNAGLVYSVSYPYYWIVFRIVSVIVYYVIGARFYYETEDWTVIDSVYFVTVSVATIGYGDYHPTSNSGRIFTAFFLVAGLVFVLTAVDELAKYGVVRAQNAFLAYISPNSTSTVILYLLHY